MRSWEQTWEHGSGSWPEEVSVVKADPREKYRKVCDCWGDNVDDDDDTGVHGTCDLIAAAPELYRALEEACQAVCQSGQEWRAEDWRKLLAKARGE